jgi:hypothetical protein
MARPLPKQLLPLVRPGDCLVEAKINLVGGVDASACVDRGGAEELPVRRGLTRARSRDGRLPKWRYFDNALGMQTLREKLSADPRFVEAEEPGIACIIVGARPWSAGPRAQVMAKARKLGARVQELREAMLALLRSLPTTTSN